MKTFVVELRAYGTYEVEIEAENEFDATERAWEEAEWRGNVEWEVDYVEQISSDEEEEDVVVVSPDQLTLNPDFFKKD